MGGVTQQAVPLIDLAKAMLRTDLGFRERVERYQSQFGPADQETLAVMAQASYFCWFHAEYEGDYVRVCRAIGAGAPTSLYLCRQVPPRRWTEMNGYVVGVQRWLGIDEPVPSDLPAGLTDDIARWLGQSTPVKRVLAALYVTHLIADLLRVSLSRLGQPDAAVQPIYADYATWYVTPDGRPLSSATLAERKRDLAHQVRSHPALPQSVAGELVSGLLGASQPACHHRFSRYQDIRISSIGALRWRGSVPPDDRAPRGAAAQWFEQASLEGWLEDIPPTTPLKKQLYAALGAASPRKRALVLGFFCGPPDGGFFAWLQERAEHDGSTVAASFCRG